MNEKLHRPTARHAVTTIALAAATFALQGARAQPAAGIAPPVAASAPAEAASSPAPAPSPAASAVPTLPAVRVQASSDGIERYTPPKGSAATGLLLAPRDTPQAVSVLTRTLLDDFRLTSLDQALVLAPGATVEKIETDRSYYTARGFDIDNFQVDGMGPPLTYGLRNGDLDTAVYERIEVIRGANGLTSGVGSPSATVNFVRKRPTRELQAAAGLTLGSWDDRRIDAQISGPLNQSGSLRGLVVAAAQDRDSYLDRYHHEKSVLHGALEADVGQHTTLALGHTQQRNRPSGTMWGALPLFFSDGSPTDYDVSTSTAPAWTYWHTDIDETYAEARHRWSNGWQATARLTHTDSRERAKLLYVYGTPERSDGSGLATWPSLYRRDHAVDVLDLRASGAYTLAGRQHELMVGASTARSTMREVSTDGPVGDPLPDLSTWNGDYPEPAFTADGGSSDFRDRQHSAYAATRLHLSDALKFIVGANATWIKSGGTGYGNAPRGRDEHKTVPYLGVVHELNDTWSVYASHTEIFKPQTQLGLDFQTLKPVQGRSSEAGVKAEWFDGLLTGSLSVFKARQDNLAKWVDTVGAIDRYVGVDTRSQGVELEIAGQLRPGLQVQAGYAELSIKTPDGAPERTYTPRRQLNLAGTWRALDALKLGANLRWRDDAHREEPGGIVIRQPAYALLDLMASYRVTDRLSATLNLRNVTDEKYVASLYWTQGYYGEPRSASVSLDWRY